MYNNFGKQVVKGANIPFTFYFLCPNNLSSNKKKCFVQSILICHLRLMIILLNGPQVLRFWKTSDRRFPHDLYF